MLVVVSGLPGTGKTTIAEQLARWIPAALFSKDEIEAALWRSEVPHASSGWAAYEVLTTLARVHLGLGCSVVLDSVATYERIRQEWLHLATTHGAAARIIETYCSDQDLHRQRVQRRQRGIPSWPELTWDSVLEVESRYEPWSVPRLRVDASEPIELGLEAAKTYILELRRQPGATD